MCTKYYLQENIPKQLSAKITATKHTVQVQATGMRLQLSP